MTDARSGPPDPARPAVSADRSAGAAELTATAALAAYSVAVAVGFCRVFNGWGFLPGLVVLVVVGHGSSLGLRLARVPGWLAVPASTVAVAWTLLLQHYRDTTSRLLPTSTTWDRLDLDIGLAREQFPTAVAPVIHAGGWAVLAAIAVAAAVVLADTLAFRSQARGEALVPGGVLFVFISALASDRWRIGSTMLVVAVGTVTVATLRHLHGQRHTVVRSGRQRLSLTVPAVVVTAAVVATIAGVVGPRLPGAAADPIYDTRGRNGGVTNIVSPLVDIRSRLTSLSDVELFRVEADRPAYWRATTLPAFDGRRFTLPERPLERAATGQPSSGEQNRQRFEIVSLRGLLVPAAADPIGAEGSTGTGPIELRINRDTSSLLAADELRAGDRFVIVSARPALTPDILRSATSVASPDPIHTDLPDDLPPIVASLAAQVTAGTSTGYDAAIALQTWFRDPQQFSYSLDVQSGHGNSAIEGFLTQRVGYCEQFAATFAAMARTLGLPSRVAVGFTPGTVGDDGRYRVTGRNAHAWPEIWFDGVGWVAFEPTPGRGEPGTEAYTGVPPAQDESAPPTTATLPEPAATTGDITATVDPAEATTTVAAPAATAPGRLPDGGAPAGGTGAGGATGTGATGGGPGPTVLVVVLAILVVVGALLTPRARSTLRERRNRRRPPTERVLTAWRRACRAAVAGGVPGSAAMTVHEWAAATAEHLPTAARPMSALAEVVERVAFAPDGAVDLERRGTYGTTLTRDCELWADQVDRLVSDSVGWTRRLGASVRWHRPGVSRADASGPDRTARR